MATRNIPSKTNTSLKKSTFNFPRGGNCPPCPPARYGPENRKDSNTFYMKQEVENCAFCLGRHAPANCKKVSDVNARKNILVKYGRCFNCLHVGPPLTPLLYNILLRFRKNRVVLVGDIENAFLNVEVDPGDSDFCASCGWRNPLICPKLLSTGFVELYLD